MIRWRSSVAIYVRAQASDCKKRSSGREFTSEDPSGGEDLRGLGCTRKIARLGNAGSSILRKQCVFQCIRAVIVESEFRLNFNRIAHRLVYNFNPLAAAVNTAEYIDLSPRNRISGARGGGEDLSAPFIGNRRRSAARKKLGRRCSFTIMTRNALAVDGERSANRSC